jgi:hypothetical protein
VRPACALVACLAVSCLTGCSGGFFKAKGVLSSEGAWRNTWTQAPQGCTRDPEDGLPDERTHTLLTLLWQDPADRKPGTTTENRPPDAPSRLTFSRPWADPSQPVVATLETTHQPGIPLDASDCSTLTLETTEHPARRPLGRPTLSGTAVLDCRVKTGHLTGRMQFERCGY